jgi:hypothetical protein
MAGVFVGVRARSHEQPEVRVLAGVVTKSGGSLATVSAPGVTYTHVVVPDCKRLSDSDLARLRRVVAANPAAFVVTRAWVTDSAAQLRRMPEANYKPLQPLAADVSVAGGPPTGALESVEAATPLLPPAYVDNLATVNKGCAVLTPGSKPGVQYAMERKHAGVFADGGAFFPRTRPPVRLARGLLPSARRPRTEAQVGHLRLEHRDALRLGRYDLGTRSAQGRQRRVRLP